MCLNLYDMWGQLNTARKENNRAQDYLQRHPGRRTRQQIYRTGCHRSATALSRMQSRRAPNATGIQGSWRMKSIRYSLLRCLRAAAQTPRACREPPPATPPRLACAAAVRCYELPPASRRFTSASCATCHAPPPAVRRRPPHAASPRPAAPPWSAAQTTPPRPLLICAAPPREIEREGPPPRRPHLGRSARATPSPHDPAPERWSRLTHRPPSRSRSARATLHATRSRA
jgi:hypothetical protein